MGVSLKNLELPEVVDTAPIKADWIPLHWSCERSCVNAAPLVVDWISLHELFMSQL